MKRGAIGVEISSKNFDYTARTCYLFKFVCSTKRRQHPYFCKHYTFITLCFVFDKAENILRRISQKQTDFMRKFVTARYAFD